MNFFRTVGFAFCCFAVVVGAASAATLHPGDKISVTVFNHPELSVVSVTLDSLGQATVPLAGLVAGSGVSPAVLGSRIRTKLLPYVRKPAVDVQLIAQGTNIFVSGGPGGILTYTPGEKLADALAQLRAPYLASVGNAAAPAPTTDVVSNGLQFSGVDLHHVIVVRDGVNLPVVDAQKLGIVGDPGPKLQPDDTIELAYKPIHLTVEGEVKRPGPVYLDADEPLSDALLQAGGPNGVASSVSFTLTRSGKSEPVSTSSAAYQAPALSGDVVYVSHALRIGVVGQVVKPGDVDLRGDGSVLSALYYAGGPTKYGDIKHVALIHQGAQTTIDVTKLTHGAPGDNPQLSDGDTVFVPEGHKIDFTLFFQALAGAANFRRL